MRRGETRGRGANGQGANGRHGATARDTSHRISTSPHLRLAHSPLRSSARPRVAPFAFPGS